MLHHAQDRIAFAVEGAALAAGEALDVVRERAAVLCAVAVAIAALTGLALTIGDGAGRPAPSAAAAEPAGVTERTFSLTLPAGWERVDAPEGAAFAGASPDGYAESTLWVERRPEVGFEAFVERSARDLDELATNITMTDRVGGRALESRIAELSADVVLDGGAVAPYRVTLRAAGPYRYYLATSVGPGAPPDLLGDAELISGSFVPTRPTASATTDGRR